MDDELTDSPREALCYFLMNRAMHVTAQTVGVFTATSPKAACNVSHVNKYLLDD